MKTFSEILATLPNIEGIARIELTQGSNLIGTIENKAGSQGSLRLYRHLAEKHGSITPAAAQEGLELYAEHTEDARNNPGKHPNIDRLLDLIEHNTTLTAHIIPE
jgi:hypothetical protein